MTRREAAVAIGFGATVAAFAEPQQQLKSEAHNMESFREMFEWSQKESKGITVWVSGQSIGGGVVKINPDTIELRSQQYRRIIVKIASIEAVAA